MKELNLSVNAGHTMCNRSRRKLLLAIVFSLTFPALRNLSAQDELPIGLPEGTKPLKGWKAEDISAFTLKNSVYLALPRVSKDATLRVPRFVGVVTDVHWLAGTEDKLSVQPEPSNWLIRLSSIPKELRKGELPVIVLEFDEPPVLFSNTIAISPNEEGMMLLRARNAIVHGDNLRFEPQPHKNTVGYWSKEEDFVSWNFEIPEDGMYEVDILQGCGAGHGGSVIELETQKQKLRITVQDTGHFQNFIWRNVGPVTLKKSRLESIAVKCVKKAGGAVMDIRALRIAPVGKERSMEGELAVPEALPKEM